MELADPEFSHAGAASIGRHLLLIFGSALIQQWEVQMIYVAFYSGLLATVRYDRFSLDGLRRRK
jgi:hypothetical protein